MSEEEIIKECNELAKNEHHELGDCWDEEYSSKAIQGLLDLYNKEKEKNKELRKYYATRKEVEKLRKINEILHDSAENYVHKDKIIAKVIQIKDRPVKDEFITATQGKLNTIIDIESLLEKED